MRIFVKVNPVTTPLRPRHPSFRFAVAVHFSAGFRSWLYGNGVKAGARQEKLKKLDESGFVAAVLALPQKGKANRAVRELVAAHFHLPVAQVRIISGAVSKNKVIEIL